MLIIKHTMETTASANAIWRIWEDVPNWNIWDYGIEFSTSNTHVVEEVAGKAYVTHQIEMRGVLAFFFAFVIGRNMRKNLPQEMAAMIKKAEQ